MSTLNEYMWNAYLELGNSATVQNMVDHVYGNYEEGQINIEELEYDVIAFANENELYIPDLNDLEYRTPAKKRKKTGNTPSSADGAVYRSPSWRATESTAERFRSPTGRSEYGRKTPKSTAERFKSPTGRKTKSKPRRLSYQSESESGDDKPPRPKRGRSVEKKSSKKS